MQRVQAVLVMVAALLGGLDAAASATWDLVAVFALIGAVSAGSLAVSRRRRPAVHLRADLVDWLDQRAAEAGERRDDVADRAVALFRSGFSGPGDP